MIYRTILSSSGLQKKNWTCTHLFSFAAVTIKKERCPIAVGVENPHKFWM
jgi:hypothetical protein